MNTLSDYQLEHLLEALRRDMRRQEELAHIDPDDALYHRFNVRRNIELLQMLNPKTPVLPTMPEQLQIAA